MFPNESMVAYRDKNTALRCHTVKFKQALIQLLVFLIISKFLFPDPGSKLRHEEENSGLLGGPPSFLQESQQKFHPCPSPHTSPAAVQTGRESLSCIRPGAGFGQGQERPSLRRKQWRGGLQVGGGRYWGAGK